MRVPNVDNHIRKLSDDFTVERDGKASHVVKGFFCSNKYPNTIQLTSDADIQENDWVIHNITQKRYFIINVRPISQANNVLGWLAKYLTENEYKQQNQTTPFSISIGSIHGPAIIGNQQTATINNGYNLDAIKSLISTKPIEDQELLNQLIERVKIVIEDNQPISKGFFGKFSDVLEKHSDIAIALGTSIINWLAGK